METHGSINTNIDQSKDLTLGVTKAPFTASVFVNGYKDGNPNAFPKPTGNSFAAAGANLGVQGQPGGVSLTGTQIPNFGNRVSLTASAHANVLNTTDHKIGVHAFTSKVFPSAPTPNYSVHGGGANYSFRDKIGAGASVAHTPIAKITETSLSTSLNLHRTPTSSLDLNAYTQQMQTPYGRTPWQHGGSISFRKQF